MSCCLFYKISKLSRTPFFECKRLGKKVRLIIRETRYLDNQTEEAMSVHQSPMNGHKYINFTVIFYCLGNPRADR